MIIILEEKVRRNDKSVSVGPLLIWIHNAIWVSVNAYRYRLLCCDITFHSSCNRSSNLRCANIEGCSNWRTRWSQIICMCDKWGLCEHYSFEKYLQVALLWVAAYVALCCPKYISRRSKLCRSILEIIKFRMWWQPTPSHQVYEWCTAGNQRPDSSTTVIHRSSRLSSLPKLKFIRHGRKPRSFRSITESWNATPIQTEANIGRYRF